jgi:23S rRNA (cytidine1920-2'-O)/16S rRNA (cytidine1409-2'-O)-methyltransferase
MAQEAVRAGLVSVGGVPATKVATLVADDAPLHLEAPARRYVSRGGEKLAAALLRFEIDPRGRRCLDAGASTGGFTDCLLQAGAERVIAVDVGYGQLAWSLRSDARVTVLERTNVRRLTPAELPYIPEIVAADLSFISLRTVMPALASLLTDRGHGVLLVKPQFELGPGDVGGGGVVREPSSWARALSVVVGAATREGLGPQGAMASPVRGPAGNVEFLLWVRRGIHGIDVDVDAAVAEGSKVAA